MPASSTGCTRSPSTPRATSILAKSTTPTGCRNSSRRTARQSDAWLGQVLLEVRQRAIPGDLGLRLVVARRRVVVEAVLRAGILEHLVCRLRVVKNNKIITRRRLRSAGR